MKSLITLATILTLCSSAFSQTCYFPNKGVSGADTGMSNRLRLKYTALLTHTACNPNSLVSACCFTVRLQLRPSCSFITELHHRAKHVCPTVFAYQASLYYLAVCLSVLTVPRSYERYCRPIPPRDLHRPELEVRKLSSRVSWYVFDLNAFSDIA